ncbi:MAG: hypothetical protein HC795_03730 [Coleofasciculaceae cyanobacterium RL_1_1]|jgi:hypothetical protein|nr:hypothetical protein [Coleofasciculaceae cyanobacterium RL_1_1]
MERGLMWLPLLVLFFGLAWAGWNEYQKVSVFQAWELQFDRAKYDVLSVLGMKDSTLTWGVSRRRGILEYGQFDLADISDLYLLVDGRRVDLDRDLADLPKGKRFVLQLDRTADEPVRLPFTDLELAAKWGQFLQSARQAQT